MKKIANKGIANGYCGLDTNSLVPVANIPNIAESQINNLNTDLNNKADLINGYLRSSEIPLNIPLTINALTTNNNNIMITTDIISQGTVNKHAVYPFQYQI